MLLQEVTDGIAVAITRAPMRVFYLGPLLCAGLLGATNPKVQSISLTGAQNYHLSQELLQRIQRLIGADLRQPAVDELVREIRNELGESSVSQKVIPGDQPEHVKVVLQVVPASDPAPTPAPEPEPVDVNVNSRYVVEGIDIRGAEERKLSDDLAEEIQERIGQRFSQDAIDDLARRIRKELRARTVASKVVRGTQPERVRLVFEVGMQREEETCYHLSKFVYHSKQAWSAKAYGDIDLGDNAALLVGIASDADTLLERYANHRKHEQRAAYATAGARAG